MEAREAQRLAPANSPTYGMTALAHLALVRSADARGAVEDAIVRGVATETQPCCCCGSGSSPGMPAS